jgi:hypothetical protein
LNISSRLISLSKIKNFGREEMFNIFMFVFVVIFFSPCQANTIQTISQNPENLTFLSQNPKLVQAILQDNFTTSIKTKNLPADISFMFLDLKIDPGRKSFKICEFGEGRLADAIYANAQINDTTYKLMTPYWHLLWEYLGQLSLPIFFVGKHPLHNKYFTYASMPMNELYGWDNFLHIDGTYAHTLKLLEQTETFKTLSKKSVVKISDMSNYQGIIVFRYFNTGSIKAYNRLEYFKKKYPQFLILNSALSPFATNKVFSASLFNEPALQQYKPIWHIYKKKYSKTLARKIKQDIKSQKFVIKPINSNRTNGVTACSSAQLDSWLKRISGKYLPRRHPYGTVFRPKHPIGNEYWPHDKNDYFLVEQFCKSKYIRLNGKLYDPSLRIYFIMHHDNQTININVLSGYWKFPPHATTDRVSFSEKNKTDPNKIDKFMGIAISPIDMKYIKETLYSFMPRVYEKMLKSYNNNFTELLSPRYYKIQLERSVRIQCHIEK